MVQQQEEEEEGRIFFYNLFLSLTDALKFGDALPFSVCRSGIYRDLLMLN